jgi:proteasome lid subunit RPN8/RPN11
MSANGEPTGGGLIFHSEPLPIARAILWGPTNANPTEPFGQPYPIFLHQQALRQLIVHTRSAPAKTFLGFLLGDLYECPESGVRYVMIDQGLRVGAEVPGDHTSSLLAKVWPRLQEQIPGQKRRLVGWYHNHPAGGADMTREDIGTHMMYFAQPWQVGLVMGTENAKPAAGWFRVSQDENWASFRHPFFEVLGADSIDPTGKKRSHVDWADFKPYKAVPPPARRPSRAAAPARPAAGAPRARASTTTAIPRVKPPAPAPSPPAAAPVPAPASRPSAQRAPAPPAPRPPVQRAPPPVQPPEPPEELEEEPVAEAPPRRPPVTRAASPPPVREAPVEDDEATVSDLPRRPSRFDRPAPARTRPSFSAFEPPPEPASAGAAPWRLWAMSGAGAGAVVLLMLAGWGLGLVHFGRVTQSGPAQGASSEAAAPPPASANPALVALDQLTDSVLGAVRVYGDRRTGFRGPEDCGALALALVDVETRWIAYNARGKPRGLVLDSERAARDQSLYAQVDTVESHFDGSACPRP